MTGGGPVEWLHWSDEAFRRAREERKPILLAVVASWARGCAEMDRICYGDASIAAQIAASVIPVRVDADDRPDIADRFDLGGLPTTAFLNHRGELLGGGTFVPVERLRSAIVAAARDPGAARAPSPGGQTAAPLPALDDVDLAELVFSTFDDEHGGFGGAPKFPLAAPIRLAIDSYAETHAPEMLDRAVLTLDSMGWGGLYDAGGGGFFRCASAPDWTTTDPEKLLVTNVSMLDLYVHAAERLGHERWALRASDVVEYMIRALVGADGGWRVSECADPARQFTDGNALAVSALLRAAAMFNDDELGRRALDALEQILLASYKPGHGVGHSATGVRGLLADHVTMAAANLDAWEVTGNVVYRMMAEELMHYALRTMWDQQSGAFFDRAAETRPNEPQTGTLTPFVLNCDAAVVLHRTGQATRDQMFAQRARQALDAMRSRAAESGPLAAHYLNARRALPR